MCNHKFGDLSVFFCLNFLVKNDGTNYYYNCDVLQLVIYIVHKTLL